MEQAGNRKLAIKLNKFFKFHTDSESYAEYRK
jgi:hypothetical protein